MTSTDEIRTLANKLLQSRVVSTHMDAMKMAESMLTIDMSPPVKKNIDNLNSTSQPVVSSPKEVVLEPIAEELSEIISEPDDPIDSIAEGELREEEDYKREAVLDSQEPESVVEQEVEHVEEESDDPIDSIAEGELREEDDYKKEAAFDLEEPEDAVLEVVDIVEQEANSVDDVRVDEELQEPVALEQEKRLESEDVLESSVEEVVSNVSESNTSVQASQDAQEMSVEEYAASKIAMQGGFNESSEVESETANEEVHEVIQDVEDLSLEHAAEGEELDDSEPRDHYAYDDGSKEEEDMTEEESLSTEPEDDEVEESEPDFEMSDDDDDITNLF